ncbi:MAG: zinc-binding dehydrogenase [Vallitaleaceae bacterium]|jgi:threonine dehydrogenase-like Zn-dependent dehydrogenase|nr:zinc-binding dehydrogenase [Vallitaleaceae bacterium]
MKTQAVRLYGKEDLRLETFELPEIKEDEILAHIISDSICMSSYKASKQGTDHKRIPNNIDTNPIIIGHEFCGTIVSVGKKWEKQFKAGQKFSIQPALNQESDPYAAPGYSFETIGGDATYIVIPSVVMELDCLLDYKGDAFYHGSVAEPMSCIIGAFHANYHTVQGSYNHNMGIVEGGKTAILAGVGPMGLGSIDYAIHCDRKPSLLVVTDIDDARLKRASEIYTVEEAQKNGIELVYLNTGKTADPVGDLMALTGGTGYDDVFVFAPVKPVVEQGDKILGHDGCLNFFAGPTDTAFSATFNFYNVHYNATHIVGTSGGNTNDLREALQLMAEGTINPSSMITHIGGLDSVVETTLNLPNIPGGKKLVYNNISMPMTALIELEELGESTPMLKRLDEIVKAHNGLWSLEAEKYLLAHAESI